ncbi:hypothetical protein Achl_2937 [Pseudarthrobacter chlorophenolicus A6]|uniref:Uncharacterized protein n=1 Tax=Pseudarthrobacter chlorophenolicus (strain ATCC 700700 / DSM 12829 / CIP 107037 / JCM 12360 / KCTC 9906 / NCIMB 13794 / A6) TaxID=452863 RepID=B8HEF4_PSECP|nr:hypothetical protein Achl_2937 [Pseudarthrobacter chlorophenolicus A6]
MVGRSDFDAEGRVSAAPDDLTHHPAPAQQKGRKPDVGRIRNDEGMKSAPEALTIGITSKGGAGTTKNEGNG